MKLTLINERAAAVPPNYREVLLSVCRGFGLDHIAYGSKFPDRDEVIAFTTYPDGWQRHYAENGLVEIDPALTHSLAATGPVDWSTFTDDPHYATVFDAAEKWGISRYGVSVPVRGPSGDVGVMSFSQNCTDAEWQRQLPVRLPHLMLTAVYMHESVTAHVRGLTDVEAIRCPRLGTLERDILSDLACGKATQEIAKIRSISRRSIELHLKGARQKLRAITADHAVARAQNLGLIEACARV